MDGMTRRLVAINKEADRLTDRKKTKEKKEYNTSEKEKKKDLTFLQEMHSQKIH